MQNAIDQFRALLVPEFQKHQEFRAQYQLQSAPGRISVITPTNKPFYLRNIVQNFITQRFPEKELIIILNNNTLDLHTWNRYVKHYDNIRVFQIDQSTSLGECLNFAVEQATGEYLARFDDDDFYAPNYLIDMVNYFDYSGATIIGKRSRILYFEESKTLILLKPGQAFKFFKTCNGGTQVFKREIFNTFHFPHLNKFEDVKFDKKCYRAGFRLYSADPFNHIQFRRTNKAHHTTKTEDDKIIAVSRTLLQTTSPTTLVVV